VDPSPDDIVVTGANGQLGRALLADLARDGHRRVRALVRSERARRTIEADGIEPKPEIHVVDYASAREMEVALAGSKCVVHLVGIIKETPGTSYVDAHERTCEALAHAAEAAGLQRIVYLSILGSTPDSSNACLASKGRAESILLAGPIAATILRVPMVLGGRDAASNALRRQARARSIRLVAGGRTLQQPIDARDVVRAIRSASTDEPDRDVVLDAGGPECLSHRELVLRAARLWNNAPKIGTIPFGLARLAVTCLDRLLPNPPISLAMFDILQHDDRVDPGLFCRELGMELTPLDQTLADHIGPESEHPR
jgi:uncharacterized protein YbjT (DUF2867 family)